MREWRGGEREWRREGMREKSGNTMLTSQRFQSVLDEI